MNLRDEKNAFVKLGLEKQNIVEMENRKNELIKEMQKIKNEQALILMHNKLGQAKGIELETKKVQLSELEQKIKESKLQIHEEIESIKLSVKNKILKQMRGYEDRLDTLDKNEMEIYTELNYKLVKINGLNYDNLPVSKNEEEKEEQEEYQEI